MDFFNLAKLIIIVKISSLKYYFDQELMSQWYRLRGNKGGDHLPATGNIFEQMKRTELTASLIQKSGGKMSSDCNLKNRTKFLTKHINLKYRLNQQKAFMFQNSLFFYTRLINDVNSDEKQFNKLMLYLNDKYCFQESRENFGFLIANLVSQRLANPQHKVQINQIIQRIYTFFKKDRSYCDFSKFAFLKLRSMVDIWQGQMCSSHVFLGKLNFEQIDAGFSTFCQKNYDQFKVVWQEFKFSKDKHQHEVATLIHRLSDLNDCSLSQKGSNYFGLLFLLKFLINQHRYGDKISDDLIKIIHNVLLKMFYLQLNRQFLFMNQFLILYKQLIKSEVFFQKIKFDIHVAVQGTAIFIKDNMIYFNQKVVEQLIIILLNGQNYFQILKQVKERLPHITSYSDISKHSSQFMSYGTNFSQRRKASHQQMTTSNKKPSNPKSFFPLHKVKLSRGNCRMKMMKYAQQKIESYSYLQLYLTLQQIYRQFKSQLNEAKQRIQASARQQRIKQLQGWYMCAYIKIMKSLKSQQNFLHAQGYMSEQFIFQFYAQILSRVFQVMIVETNFQEMLQIIHLEQCTSKRTLHFDISGERFGLRQIFQFYANGNKVFAETTLSIYEFEVLLKYYNLISYRVDRVKNKQALEKGQRLLRFTMGKKQKLNEMRNKEEEEGSKEKRSEQDGRQPKGTLFSDGKHLFKRNQNIQFVQRNQFNNYFLKTQIFRLLDRFNKHHSMSEQKRKYYQIICSLVIVIDNQSLLMDIFSNVIYSSLQSNKPLLIRQTYQTMRHLRTLFSSKFSNSFNHTSITRKAMICIFERLKRLQTMRNKSSTVSTFKPQTKQIYNDYYPKQSSVYREYFNSIFQGRFVEIMSYGEQLFEVNKFRQCVFILENLREDIGSFQQHYEENCLFKINKPQRILTRYDHKINVQQQNIKQIIHKCDNMLLNCYAQLSLPFMENQQFISNRCLSSKDKKQESHPGSYSSQNQLKLSSTRTKHNSLIQKVCQIISSYFVTLSQNVKNYWPNFQKGQDKINQWDSQKFITDHEILKHNVYQTITNFSFQNINQISSRQDLQYFYLSIIISGLLFGVKQQNIYKMTMKIHQSINEKINDDFLDKQMQNGNGSQLNPGDQLADMMGSLSHQKALKDLLPMMQNKQDKFNVLNLLRIFQFHTDKNNPQTTKLYYNSILQSKKYDLMFGYVQNVYEGLKYQHIGLLQLQMLIKFYFNNQEYQKVKIIAKNMKNQKAKRTYGQLFSYFVNWPQVLGYELISKIYDMIPNQFTRFQKQICQIINQQTHLMLGSARYQLRKLKQPNQLQGLMKCSKLYQKLISQLQNKIKHYFELFRIIFDRLDLSNQNGLRIFTVFHEFYEKLFIQNVASQNSNINFFFYYLRFLNEKVDSECFLNGQANEEKKKVEKFLLSNIKYTKSHTLYMIKSMDSQQNTQKNVILRNVLVQILCRNPYQNCWTLTLLKNYVKVLPNRIVNGFPSSSIEADINMKYNNSMRKLYQQVRSKLVQYDKIVQIPEFFITWMHLTSKQHTMGVSRQNYTLAQPTKTSQAISDINKRLASCKGKIPYPFDHSLYIRNFSSLQMASEGKSAPFFIAMRCGLYNQLSNQKKQKTNKSTSQSQHNKHIVLKNNFTQSEHRIQTNSANFYKQIRLLDEETTYGIMNLTKYVLLIEKLTVQHQSLKDFIRDFCSVDDEFQRRKSQKKREFYLSYEIFKKQSSFIQPKWFDQFQRLRQNNQLPFTPSLSYSFYRRGLDKWENMHSWWTYLNNFIRTLAYWSYVSFVTKLGDRHLTNILVSSSGKFMHIDYQYNFGHGLSLPCPQWIPFRLTKLLTSAMGAFRQKGLFFAYFIQIAKKFDLNSQNIWKSLAHFSPVQRKIISETCQFKIYSNKSLQQKCETIIQLALDKQLIRTLFLGWSADM